MWLLIKWTPIVFSTGNSTHDPIVSSERTYADHSVNEIFRLYRPLKAQA